MSLHLVKQSFSVNPWRLVQRLEVDGQVTERRLPAVGFHLKRDGLPWLQLFLGAAEWETPMAAWPDEALRAVGRLLAQVPSVREDETMQHKALADIRATRRVER